MTTLEEVIAEWREIGNGTIQTEADEAFRRAYNQCADSLEALTAQPALPEAGFFEVKVTIDGTNYWKEPIPDCYTADQLRAYGQACRLAPAPVESVLTRAQLLEEGIRGMMHRAKERGDEYTESYLEGCLESADELTGKPAESAGAVDTLRKALRGLIDNSCRADWPKDLYEAAESALGPSALGRETVGGGE